MNPTKIKEVLDLTKQGISTFYYIGQMARYRYQYSFGKELHNDGLVHVNVRELAQNRDNLLKYTCLTGLGILGLFAIGVSDLNNRRCVLIMN